MRPLFDPPEAGEQANMRAARVGARIIEVTTTATRFKRLVESGYWNRKALEALERQGFDGVVYLNGMIPDVVTALSESITER